MKVRLHNSSSEMIQLLMHKQPLHRVKAYEWELMGTEARVKKAVGQGTVLSVAVYHGIAAVNAVVLVVH